ncbi:hypothetical protein FJT64_004078 [Amphibalanus amphitrite]|uniref:EB domain-containing protein n=1 Tax=Amphibalanus amphitrite TaxID=1232801 RepID=A0A6A4VB66_AMPAM|nr:hypothetical protein FJT64_010934 [Amphibalanus amphitrite]KAF0298567.1 hypothetical protein FJT64_004078 [Amphibalanus amphitrite]
MRHRRSEYEGILNILHICMLILVALFFLLMVLCLWNMARLVREIVKGWLAHRSAAKRASAEPPDDVANDSYTSWLDTCLPRRGLREPCEVNPQCRARDEHSVCLPEKSTCGCLRGYRNIGGRCQFMFAVTEPTLPPAEDAELERVLGISRAGRRREQELHRQSFVRGLAVTGVLVGFTFFVFTVAWLVSRRVRQKEREEAEALPEKYAAPPPYSVSKLGGSYDDMAAAVAYNQAGPVA